jgi:hypothetical protein
LCSPWELISRKISFMQMLMAATVATSVMNQPGWNILTENWSKIVFRLKIIKWVFVHIEAFPKYWLNLK